MIELLLARGGGRGLFEETFLFGTTSDEDETDGDNPNSDLVVDFDLSNGPLLLKPGKVLQMIKKVKILEYVKSKFFLKNFLS